MRTRRFAIGDPQAPFSTLLAILAHNDVIDSNEDLLGDVLLVAIGDYFDYGAADKRHEAARSGLELLTWLAAQSPDQAVLIAGNHDLGRIGELADFSDDAFSKAHVLARNAYRDGSTDAALEDELLAQFPALPTAEIAARDFAAFSLAQRDLVTSLLRRRRLCLAHAIDGTLFCHAGITTQYLESLGLADASTADEIAAELNRRLYEAFDSWTGGPMAIPSVHAPGHSTTGEGVGMLYHRPANPAEAINASYELGQTMTRRYDARDIPPGLTQVVGHISDNKCRQLLGASWTTAEATPPGAIRSMTVRAGSVSYGPGLPAESSPQDGVMIFIDGGMNRTAIADYQLYRF